MCQLTVFHVVESPHHVHQALSPELGKQFAADGQRVVHGLLQSELEHADEILEGLVDVGQAFGNILMDGRIAVGHVVEEDFEEIVVFAQKRDDRTPHHLIVGLGDKGLGVGFFHPLTGGKQRGLQV